MFGAILNGIHEVEIISKIKIMANCFFIIFFLNSTISLKKGVFIKLTENQTNLNSPHKGGAKIAMKKM